MENNGFITDCNIKLLDYIVMVNDIASDYFDIEGNYIPHVGKINAMRIFYNECIKEKKEGFPEKVEDDLKDMELITGDLDFIKAFNKAIQIDLDNENCLDFGNAYKDALDIVNTRKDSFTNATDTIKNALIDVVGKISTVFTKDNLDKFASIANDIKNGNITQNSIVDAYNNSNRVSEIFGEKL